MRVVIVGCGIIGATIAYELSRISGLEITVCDRQLPACEATGAALGVLMGIISQKTKGRSWELRQDSMKRYDSLVSKLEAATGEKIPYNRNGILKLLYPGDKIEKWQNLVEVRAGQGWNLQLLDIEAVRDRFSYLNLDRAIAAIYSPDDRQVDPVALTKALVAASRKNGVRFEFDFAVTDADIESSDPSELKHCQVVKQGTRKIECDRLILAAGLGSTPFTQKLDRPTNLIPVLGQALQLKLDGDLGNSEPIITADDVHIVPLRNGEYWVGATVEFPPETGELVADPQQLDTVLKRAIAFCPPLETGTIVRQWQGLRPRPQNEAAPILRSLPGYNNIMLATGHYRNGILLAPATAKAVCHWLSS